DVAVADSIDSLVAAAVRECGGVDVLINNAGVACTGRIEEFDLANFDRMIAVNVSGVFYASRAVWPIMLKRGGGVIVNISSTVAVDPIPGFAAYGATKNFVEGLTRSLAKEGKKCGIRVYAVGPGAVDTQMLRGPYPDFPADDCLQPEEVAETVFMMTQSACRYSAGQTVYVTKL
ncbi:MAG: SDR family oxidoreductase, partial [Planctomycetes bacterium]|nr:SDR family oxidoreductase [Planctomycetota bacterium]